MNQNVASFYVLFDELKSGFKMLPDVCFRVVGDLKVEVLNMLRQGERVLAKGADSTYLQFFELMRVVGDMFSADVESVVGGRATRKGLSSFRVLRPEVFHVGMCRIKGINKSSGWDA